MTPFSGIQVSCHFDVRLRSYIWWIWNESVKIAPSTKFEYNQAINLKIIQVSLFFHPQKLSDTLEANRLPWQQIRTMSTVNVCKMTLKAFRSKWSNFISLSFGVLELLRKVSWGGGGGFHPPVQISTILHIKANWYRSCYFFCSFPNKCF